MSDRSAQPPLISPLISIVIPAFNARATLDRALDSVVAQTHPRWEVLVVDDASSDDTVARLEARAVPHCRVIRRSMRGGPSAARNTGIAAANGEFVAFLDADDEWLPEKLARQVAVITDTPTASLAICDMRSLYEDGREGNSIFARQAPTSGPLAWKALLASSFIGTSAALAPRALLQDMGGFNTLLAVGEDQDLFIRLALRGEVVVVPEALATYHYRRGSYSSDYTTEQAAIVLNMVRRHMAAQRNNLSWVDRRRILAQRYGRLGRNLIAAGARGRGVSLILKAACLGGITLENLLALPRAARL